MTDDSRKALIHIGTIGHISPSSKIASMATAAEALADKLPQSHVPAGSIPLNKACRAYLIPGNGWNCECKFKHPILCSEAAQEGKS
jgi:hypothetical protein